MASAQDNENGAAAPMSHSDATRHDDALVPVEYQNGTAGEMGWPMDHPYKPEILNATPTFATMWKALCRRWPLAFGLGILLSVAGMLLTWYFVPIQYTAVARLQVSPPGVGILGDFRAKPTKQQIEADRQTQRALIKSQFVLLAALRKNDISQLPMILKQGDNKIAWLQENIRALFTSADSEILDIKVEYRDPEQAKRLVNAVQEAYLREVVDAEKARELRKLEELQLAFSKNYAALHKKRIELETIVKSMGIDPTGPEMKARLVALSQEIRGLGQQKSDVERELFALSMQIEHIKKLASEGIWPPPPDPLIVKQYVDSHPEVQALNNHLFQLRQFYQEEKRKSRDQNSRALRQLQEQIEGVNDSLAETRSRIQIEAEAHLAAQSSRGGSAADAIEEIKSQELLWISSIKKIDVRIGEATASLKGFEAQSVDMEQKGLEVEQLVSTNKTMNTEIQKLLLRVNAPSRIIRLEEAHVPERAGSWIIKMVIVAFVGVVGFVLGTGGVCFAEFQSRRVGSSEDISHGLGQTVVGTLPSLSGGLVGRGGGPHLQAMLSDSIDSIRATLIHNTSTDSLRVVMVTSPLDREGKTTLASQLAASLARGGKRTVLVDGDVRNPTCHQLFELNCDPGLSEVLREEAEVDDVVQATRIANLWLVPAGRCDNESIQALAQPVTGDLFDQLRSKFDFVVVDAGAVLTVADSLLIGQHADGAVLSVLKDVSRTPDVHQAAERLKSVGINLMGTVVSGEDNRSQKRMYQRQLANAGG
jgi:capsular exopolysaccharide synthesis family protein